MNHSETSAFHVFDPVNGCLRFCGKLSYCTGADEKTRISPTNSFVTPPGTCLADYALDLLLSLMLLLLLLLPWLLVVLFTRVGCELDLIDDQVMGVHSVHWRDTPVGGLSLFYFAIWSN